jgi:hypothetical protein
LGRITVFGQDEAEQTFINAAQRGERGTPGELRLNFFQAQLPGAS